MIRVQVSARNIRWPQACACCGSATQEHIRVSFTRVTGQQVIHANTRWWEVPYCSSCTAHVAAQHEADQAARSPFLVFGFVLVVDLLLTGLAGLFVYLGLVGAGLQERWYFWPLTVLLTLGVGALVVWVMGLASADAAKKRDRLLNAVQAASKVNCCCPRAAVEYQGWYGSVHTFKFHNHDYAASFKQSNRGKQLSS
jgi:hypothetical protein